LVEKIEILEEGTSLVTMKEISHIVICENSYHFLPFPDKNNLRKLMVQLKVHVTDGLGIMMLDNDLNMKLFVYIVAIDTFFETACGSGTIAWACVLCKADPRRKIFRI
jgi:diaminopimelate epimerase